MELFAGRIDVHYGFLDLVDLDDDRRAGASEIAGQSNGLCGVAVEHLVHLVTGLHSGSVPVVVRWSEEEPPLEDWPDVVEASAELAQDLVLAGFEDSVPVRLPRAGWHRVRFHARNMDEGRELDTAMDDDEVPDAYLLQLWPAPPAPDAVLRVGSETAQYWHDAARTGG